MLGLVRLLVQKWLARLAGWRLCEARTNERQSRMLKKLSRQDDEGLTITDCLVAEADEVSGDFLLLRGIGDVRRAFRRHPERLFWLRPAPRFMDIRHVLSGREASVGEGGYSEKTVEE
jgi:hypothetical protein